MRENQKLRSTMARTRVGGVEKGRPALPKRNFPGDETGERVEEQPKTRKVIKINHVHHVVEWIPETEAVSGEPAEENSNIPVKLKEITRLETPEECEKRKAAYAEAKRMALENKLKFWLVTAHPWLEIRAHHGSLGQSIKYRASPNCYLGIPPYERHIKSPQVFVSCIEVTKKSVSPNKKNYLVVGMLVQLFSYAVSPVLLHSIIMHQEAPHR